MILRVKRRLDLEVSMKSRSAGGIELQCSKHNECPCFALRTHTHLCYTLPKGRNVLFSWRAWGLKKEGGGGLCGRCTGG